ncbi:hypothetical protein D920_01186 [Enterococcus faecalis 13-SD-W-01]|nr:hypothetical protein D920_01186 [Enterococcus faecalis 13-SD-W-01]
MDYFFLKNGINDVMEKKIIICMKSVVFPSLLLVSQGEIIDTNRKGGI